MSTEERKDEKPDLSDIEINNQPKSTESPANTGVSSFFASIWDYLSKLWQSLPAWVRGLVTLLTILAGAATFVLEDIPSILDRYTVPQNRFPDAVTNEQLIILSTPNGSDRDMANILFTAIDDTLIEQELTETIRIERYLSSEPFVEEVDALPIGERKDAALVIWGNATNEFYGARYAVLPSTDPPASGDFIIQLPEFRPVVNIENFDHRDYLIYTTLGMLAYLNQDYEQAVLYLDTGIDLATSTERTIETDLSLEAALAYRATAHLALGNSEQAQADINQAFSEATDRRPQGLLHNLQGVLFVLENDTLAANSFETSLEFPISEPAEVNLEVLNTLREE